MDFVRQLKKERRVEAELLNYYEAEAEKNDSGCRLVVRNRKNGKREYYVKPQGSRREVFLGRKPTELVKKLRHQRLCAEGKRVLEKNLQALKKLELYIQNGILPGKNLILDSGGHMDRYYDTVYRIEAGHLVVVNSGYYGAEDNSNVHCDENGHPIYQYFWNDKEVSEAVYFEQLNSIFPPDKAVGDDYGDYDWQNYYGILETLS